MKLFRYGLLLAALLPQWSHASVGINSMIEFAESGEGHFTISNAGDFRQFISVAISSVEVKDGELVKTPYTRDNIDKWSLNVRPSRTVVDPGASKIFKVTYEPKLFESKDRDKVYQLIFVPTPYFSKGEPNSSSVQVAVGFAPIFLVPAETDQPLNYDVTFNGESISLNNHGNSYIRAFFDACPAKVTGRARESCTKVVYGISGRNLTIPLNDEMQKVEQMSVEVSTHSLKYKEEHQLKKNQTIKG